MRISYYSTYSLLFLVSWSGLAWCLLSGFGWNATLTSMLAAVGVSYVVVGVLALTAVAISSPQFQRWFSRESRDGLLVRTHPVRVFIPAEVLRLHRQR